MKSAIEQALRDFLETDDDAVAGALIVAQILDPAAAAGWAREEIARLADEVRGIAEVAPADMVAAMAEQGFEGAGERYYELDNSMLDRVLRNRRGIPISLGVVLIGVATRLGLAARGVNFPRHFLVQIGDVLVDPYAMAPTSMESCRRWLKDNQVSERGAFDVTRPRDVVLRMLNNVRVLIQQRGDFARALEVSDYQLLIVPDYYGLYVERADAWLGLNAPEMVVAELQKAVERAPDAPTAQRLRERVEQARHLGDSTVH